MSSDDSGFDKEAEREKLREKYERDKEDRENTQRMSELLLQGATMTGKHCGDCGDPIFRYDGQEFCPTCQREVEGGAGGQGTSERETDEQEASEQSEARADPQDADRQGADQPNADQQHTNQPDAGQQNADEADARVEDATGGEPTADEGRATDGEPRVEINDVRVADRHADRSSVRQPPSQQGERDATNRQRDATSRHQGPSGPRTHDHSRERSHSHERSHAHSGRRRGASAADADDLATARESLVRKLTDLARRAEETDDVTRSRELLEATREAAEALAALDRANR